MSNQITRKDIIEDEALRWGVEYEKMMQKPIEKNKEFVSTLLEIYEANKKVRSASNDSEYQNSIKRTNELTQTSIGIWKEQIQLENALISTKRKNELATESTNRALVKERAVLAETNQEIKKHVIANGALQSAYKKLSAQLSIASDRVKNIRAEGKLATETQQQYNIRLIQAQSIFDKLNKKVRAADEAVGQFNRNVGNYPKQAADGLKNLISAFGLVSGVSLFASIMKDAFNITRDFEKEIVNLGAIAEKSREEIAPLEAKIREVAKSSINGATDVAKLATELIKLGSTPEEVEKLLEPVNNLSVALQSSAEDSATLVKSIMNAYGLGAEETARITDVLAESANRSALDFQGLRDSFSYLAPAAKAVNISVEKTAAILGTLADNGIKAESAGRLTSTAFARLANQGLTLEDALNKINKAQKDGSSELEVLALASNLFGAEAGKIGLILANNREKIEESTKAYENSNGALKELTNKQLKSLDSELKILSSSWEDYILDTNTSTNSTISLTSGVRFLSTNLNTVLKVLGYMVAAWLAYKTSLIAANVQTRLMAVLTKQSTIEQARLTLTTQGSTAAQIANAEATIAAGSAWQRFNTALKANALGIALAVLIYLVSTMNSFGQSLNKSNEELKKSTDNFLKNRETISKNEKAIKTLSDRYDVLTSKSKLNKEEQKELDKIISILAKTVPDAVKEVDKYGDALSINTTKTRAYTQSQKELADLQNKSELQKNIILLQDLNKEQEYNNRINKSGYGLRVEGIGLVTKVNGILYKEGTLNNRKLNAEEQVIFKKKIVDNEIAIAQTKARIAALKGLTETEKITAKETEDASKKTNQAKVRTIEVIDAEIAALKEKIPLLSDKSGKEGNIIKAKLKALEAEKELIYSTQEAEKNKFKTEYENAKKIKEAIHALSQFRLQVSMNEKKEILEDEKQSFEDRVEALYQFYEISDKKAKEQAIFELEQLGEFNEKKGKFIRALSDKQVQEIIQRGSTTRALTATEQLIYEKYQNDLTQSAKKGIEERQKLIDSQVDLVKKEVDYQLQQRDTALQKELQLENEAYLKKLELADGNNNLIQEAAKKHEKALLEIKRKAALDDIDIQLKAYENLKTSVDGQFYYESLSYKERANLDNELATLRKERGDLEVENVESNAEKKLFFEEENFKKIEEKSKELTQELINLTNAIFDAKISKIDDEISANDEYYNKQIQLAGDDARKKDALEKEAEKKREALEAKKRKEQHKQAVFNKAISMVEIGLKTAQAVVAALAIGPPQGYIFAAISAAIGIAQLAAVAATPIPKYKHGTKGAKAGLAEVGDGYVSEVITDRYGNNPTITPNVPTFTYLNEGDIVHKSVDDYQKYVKASMYNDLEKNSSDAKRYQILVSNNNGFDEKLIEKAIENGFKKARTNVNVHNKIDLGHEMWKLSNTNWKA